MKRLALLSVVSLMLASAVFAPVALAQEPGEVDVQSVKRGPGGSVTVTGTIQCVEGQALPFYSGFVEVRQRTSGNVFLSTEQRMQFSGECTTTELVPFTFTEFGRTAQGFERPFHKGPGVVRWATRLCVGPGGEFPCEDQSGIEAVRIR
jgi:hypothetical protein